MPGLSLLTVAFGEPEHGWLPVTLQTGDFQLHLNASAVPANPLEVLCETLTVVSAGGSAKSMWNLEPAVCWFVFEYHAHTLTLEIKEAPTYNQTSTCTLKLTGSTRAILFPFYKALADFTARNFSEKHWPALAEHKIKQLGQLLRGQR